MTRRACALLAVLLAACTPSVSPSVSPSARLTAPATISATPSPSPQPPAPVVPAAGDIAGCDSNGDEATAELLGRLEGTILTLGDNAYPDGTAAECANCYGPTWGRHLARTFPSAGNHDYETDAAAGYFGYFGPAAGEPGEGWYSFDLGAWHLIGLNSNCDEIGGCGLDSPQAAWLRAIPSVTLVNSGNAQAPAPTGLSYRLPTHAFQMPYASNIGPYAGTGSAYGTTLSHRAELSDFDLAKGTVRFAPDHPVPADLVARMVRARMAETDAGADRTSRHQREPLWPSNLD
jgi:hypothetical protein